MASVVATGEQQVGIGCSIVRGLICPLAAPVPSAHRRSIEDALKELARASAIGQKRTVSVYGIWPVQSSAAV